MTILVITPKEWGLAQVIGHGASLPGLHSWSETWAAIRAQGQPQKGFENEHVRAHQEGQVQTWDTKNIFTISFIMFPLNLQHQTIWEYSVSPAINDVSSSGSHSELSTGADCFPAMDAEQPCSSCSLLLLLLLMFLLPIDPVAYCSYTAWASKAELYS